MSTIAGQLDSTSTPYTLGNAQTLASNIASSASPAIGSNTFVFFAAFDGTDNAYKPVNGDLENTSVAQLLKQVKTNVVTNGSVQAEYYPGPGTPGTVGASEWLPTSVAEEARQTALKAYDDFAKKATTWLQDPAHAGGTITSMIVGFSRGCAAQAIFAQLLFEKGLVNAEGKVLIPPGTVGAVSAALALDPVLTGKHGNMDFPPGVQNFTVVRAAQEYRSNFLAADYGSDGQSLFTVPGNHSDIGGGYGLGGGTPQQQAEQNLGAIYLQGYTDFFANAGLNIAPVAADRRYNSAVATYIHSESLTGAALALAPWQGTYNESNALNFSRHLNTNWGTAPSNSVFTTFNNDIVVNGAAGIVTGA